MKIEKVLIVSDFSNPWTAGYCIQRGFQHNNIEVEIFDPQTAKNPYTELMSLIELFKPHMLLYIKKYGLKIEWLEEAKKKGIVIIQWYIDPVIPEWLIPYLKIPDVFFTMSEGLIDEFKRLNANNVFWLTEAFEPSFAQIKEITPEDIKTFSTEVTFVGNLGSKSYYLPRRKYLKRVIKEGFKLKWWGPRLPRKISTVPLILGKLGRSYGGKFIWGEEYTKVAKLSKVFLAFEAQPHIRKSMSSRMYNAVGCGAFYMCQYVGGIEDVLEPGKEIITFHSEQEMIDLIRYYMENDTLREKIADAGRIRVLKEHTYEVRTKQMLRIIEDVI